MNTPSNYQCRCGNEANASPSSPPPGWEWHGSELLCGDCVRSSSFSHGNESAAVGHKGTATPVRLAASNSETSILLRSGAYLDLSDPDCSRIEATDIAAGLRQLRFAGQTIQPYTIAQHSLLVLSLIEPVAKEIGNARGDMLRWCALLHDAAEAFIHDITRPLKSQLPDYQKIEARFERRLCQAFSILWNDRFKALVKLADRQALAIERRDLLPETQDGRPWPILADLNPHVIAAVRIERVWSPEEAEARFLETFNRLYRPERIAA